MNDKLKFQILQVASGYYLCASYPDNWENLTEEAQLEFVSDNPWEPFENYDPEYVMGCINSAAQVTQEFIEDLSTKSGKVTQ